MRRLFEGIRRITAAAERTDAGLPPLVDALGRPILPGDDRPDPDGAEHAHRAAADEHAKAEIAALQAARREQRLPPRPWRLAACADDRHLVDAIAADRDRLEQINDRLRAQIVGLRAEVEALRAKADA